MRLRLASDSSCGVRVQPPGRARPRRDGPAIWRRDQRSRLARSARVLALREPSDRYGRHRDRAARALMPSRTKFIGSQTEISLLPRGGRYQPGASNHIITPASAAIAAARRTMRRNVFAAGMPAMLPGRDETVVNQGAAYVRVDEGNAAGSSRAASARSYEQYFRKRREEPPPTQSVTDIRLTEPNDFLPVP
jgi:hypothetical protein